MKDDWDSDEWLADHLPSILEVQKLMAEALSDNPARVYEQLSKAEAWLARINPMSADANARLDRAEYRMLMALPEGHTVDQKRIIIRNGVVKDRRMRDILKGLSEAVTNRLILGMNLRRQHAGERSDY